MNDSLRASQCESGVAPASYEYLIPRYLAMFELEA